MHESEIIQDIKDTIKRLNGLIKQAHKYDIEVHLELSEAPIDVLEEPYPIYEVHLKKIL